MQHEVEEHNLEGGARLLAIRIPNTITFYWASTFRAGYRYVPVDRYELPHLAEHLAFEGTKSYPDAQAFKIAVEQDGTYYNASTSFEQVSYLFSGSREELGRIIPINLSQIYEPLYGRKQIAQEQKVIEQEMGRKKEEDGWRLGYLGERRIVPARNPEIEERIANIGKITQEDLRAYHEQCYGLANTAFIVAGDYTAAEVRDVVGRLNKELAGRPVGERQEPGAPELGEFGGTAAAYEPIRQEQSLFSLQFIRAGREEEHYYALRVIAVLLTGGLSARLQRKAREAGLTYGIHAGASRSHDYTALSIRSQTSLAKLRPLVQLAAEELAAVGAGDYSDAELERAIGYTTGSLRRSHQTPASYAGWYSKRFVSGYPLESPEEWIAHIAAVDRPAIAAAFAAYVRKPQRMLTLIGAGLEKLTDEYQELLDAVLT